MYQYRKPGLCQFEGTAASLPRLIGNSVAGFRAG